MLLYGTVTSPFVRKVRIAAKLTALPLQLEIVNTNPVVPNETYAQSNPLMRVPALRLATGLVLADSKLICEYFDYLKPNILLPTKMEERLAVQAIHYLSDGALDSAVSIRYELAVRPAELRWQNWLVGQETKIRNALSFLNQQKEWLERSTIYLDHIAVVCLLDYLLFRNILPNWQSELVNLERLRSRLSQLPAFQETLPKEAT